MDNIKIESKIVVLFILSLFLLENACYNTSKTKSKGINLDLDIWNKTTKSFVQSKCDPNGLLKAQLKVPISYSDSMTFNTLDDYIQFRLSYRLIIRGCLKSKTDFKNLTKLRIEEFYDLGKESTRVITTSKITNKVEIFLIGNTCNIKKVEEIKLEDYSENNYEDDCILSANNSIIAKFTIVTDFISSGGCITKFASFYY